VVHVANALVHALDLAGAAEAVPPIDAGAWARLALAGADAALLARIEREFEQLRAVLRPGKCRA
jgi:hypothetical protein